MGTTDWPTRAHMQSPHGKAPHWLCFRCPAGTWTRIIAEARTAPQKNYIHQGFYCRLHIEALTKNFLFSCISFAKRRCRQNPKAWKTIVRKTSFAGYKQISKFILEQGVVHLSHLSWGFDVSIQISNEKHIKVLQWSNLNQRPCCCEGRAPTTAPPSSQSSLIKLEKQTFWTTGFGETDKHHKTISNRIFFIWKGRVIQQQPSCSKSNLKFLELFLRSSSLSHFEDVKPHSFAERSALSNGHDVSNGDVSAERRSSKR